MPDGYTPTTEQVRADFVLSNTRNHDAYLTGRSVTSEREHYEAGFDAWLAAHDEQVRHGEQDRIVELLQSVKCPDARVHPRQRCRYCDALDHATRIAADSGGES